MMTMAVASSIVSFVTQMARSTLPLPASFGVAAVAISISGVVAVLRDAGRAADPDPAAR